MEGIRFYFLIYLKRIWRFQPSTYEREKKKRLDQLSCVQINKWEKVVKLRLETLRINMHDWV